MRKPGTKEISIIIGIFVLAFAIRCIYLFEMRSSPLFDTPTMDAEYHDQWAQMILKGEEIHGGVFFRAPLYPYFLALIYRMLGRNFLAVRLIQFFIGSLSCVLVYWVGQKVFNRRVAAIAGVMASLYGVMIFFDGELLLPVLEVFSGLLVILAIIRAREKPSYRRWILGGMLLGLSALIRPNILLVGMVFFFWILIRSTGHGRIGIFRILGSKAMIYAGCLALGTMLVILPVTLRNYVKGHDLVLISSQGGMNFYIGNNPQADGASAILPGGRATWWGSYEDAIRIAEKSAGKTLKPSEVSRFWYREGLKFAGTQPFKFLKLMLKKLVLFWNGNELSNNKDFYFFARSAPILKPLIWRFVIYFPLGMIAALALVGIMLAHKDKKDVVVLEIFLFVYMLSIILFFVTERYRVPILPVLILFAAYALNWFVSAAKRGKYSELGKYLIIFVAILTLVNLPIPGYSSANPGKAHYTLGVVYSQKGDNAKAEEEYQKAIEYNPGLGNAYTNLGSIYGDQGKHRLALEYYEKAIQNGADSAFVWYNIGIEYFNQGLLEQAQKYYQLSLQVREDDPKVHYLLAGVFLGKGMLEQSIQEYKKTLEYDPQDALAYLQLGNIYRQLSRKQEAIDNLKNFVRWWKGDPGRTQDVMEILKKLETKTSKEEETTKVK